MPIASGPDDPSALRAWGAALDEIEASLRTADALIVDAAASNGPAPASSPDVVAAQVVQLAFAAEWTPPAGLGQVPDALVPRASAVFDALQAVTGRIAEAHAAVGAELTQLADSGRNQAARRAGYGDEVPSPRLVDHDA